MGTGGYVFHDKDSGEPLGTLQPRASSLGQVYHIVHPTFEPDASNIVDVIGNFGTQNKTERFTPMAIGQGPLTMDLRRNVGEERHVIPPLEEDEWGAGLILDSHMVGVSRGGRILWSWCWEQAIRRPQDLALFAVIIECEPSGDRSFDLGGWLSIQ